MTEFKKSIMINQIRKTSRSKFVRNVTIVATGTASAQLITIVFSPIITRIYGPEAFGLLGTFMALVNVLIPIAALAYPIAIVLPKEDIDAKGIALLSAYLALGIAGCITLVLLLTGDWFVELLNVQAISEFILLIPMMVLFSAWLQINQQWLIRKKQFKITSMVAVAQAFIFNSAKVGIGWFKPLAAVLIVLTTAGVALHAIMLSFGAKQADTTDSQKDAKPKTPLKELAKRHNDFPLYRAPQVFINAISQSLPILMLASFFGPSAAGFYTLGKSVMGMPSELIGKSVGDVFYPRVTEAAQNGENLTRLVFKATSFLAIVGFLPFGFVVVFGPWLFSFVFGSEWGMAGEYARWLALWMFFMFLNRPSVQTLPILSAQRFHLVFTFFTIAARLSVLVIGYHIFNSDLIAIALFGISGAIINILLVVIILSKCKAFDDEKLKKEVCL